MPCSWNEAARANTHKTHTSLKYWIFSRALAPNGVKRIENMEVDVD